jgi:hypothetical protein
MRTIQEYPLVLQEAWAMHNLLGCLGFQTKDMFFAIDEDGQVGVVLRAQDKEFSTICGIIERGEIVQQRFCKQWLELVESLPGQADVDLREAWEQSRTYQWKADAMMALRQRGFVFPRLAN